MEWRIEICAGDRTIAFAAEELACYLKKMDASIDVAILDAGESPRLAGTLRIEAANGDYGGNLPAVDNPGLDDAWYIDVSGGAGVICGSNPRSALFGVYRYLGELGCRWLRPGPGGEIIPRLDPGGRDVRLSDRASYRHRGVCIEGSCSYGHVLNLIEWLPKVGMNGYFTQFFTPYTFFDQWYSHPTNPYMAPQPVSMREAQAMVNSLVAQIKKRGLLYHAVGHGWTCEPLGIEGSGWDVKDYAIPEGAAELFAMIGGRRELYGGVPLNTNLCYSNPRARELIVSAIADYCRAHTDVDYLHFWLADGINNHCECDNCKDTIPSDFFVQMLNELDRRLAAEGIPTKIVFLIYVDLLWEPQRERLINQERFTLMFAPITRTYTASFISGRDGDGRPAELAPYARNKNEMPRKVDENIRRLGNWQRQFSGDGFDFDYHLIWDHYYDMGGHSSARVLFEDMVNLDKLGLNGMLSCQVQRAFFPTGLGMYAMARALWDKELCFERVADAFYADMFGADAQEMSGYFRRLSELFDPPYLRGEKAYVDEAQAARFAKIPYAVNEMLPLIAGNMEREAADPCKSVTWRALAVHAQLCVYLAGALAKKAAGDQAGAAEAWEVAKDYANRMEPAVHELLDVKYFTDVMGRAIARGA